MARLARRNFDRLVLPEDHRLRLSVKTDPSQFGGFVVKTRPTSPVDFNSFGLDNFTEGGEASLIESETPQKSV